jgi:hypothetical protein
MRFSRLLVPGEDSNLQQNKLIIKINQDSVFNHGTSRGTKKNLWSGLSPEIIG